MEFTIHQDFELGPGLFGRGPHWILMRQICETEVDMSQFLLSIGLVSVVVSSCGMRSASVWCLPRMYTMVHDMI